MIVDGDSLFIPIREHIDLTENTQLDVQRIICRQRRLLIRFAKSAAVQAQSMKTPICVVKDLRTGANMECEIKKGGGNFCTLIPTENSFMDAVEVALVDKKDGRVIGVQIFDGMTGLKKIEESFLTVHSLQPPPPPPSLMEEAKKMNPSHHQQHHQQHHHHKHHKQHHHHHDHEHEQQKEETEEEAKVEGAV